MNYINICSAGLCYALGESDRLEIEETGVLVDCETGKVMHPFSWEFVFGRKYRYERRWVIRQTYNTVKTCVTREEAQKAYDGLIEKLAVSNVVINI